MAAVERMIDEVRLRIETAPERMPAIAIPTTGTQSRPRAPLRPEAPQECRERCKQNAGETAYEQAGKPTLEIEGIKRLSFARLTVSPEPRNACAL